MTRDRRCNRHRLGQSRTRLADSLWINCRRACVGDGRYFNFYETKICIFDDGEKWSLATIRLLFIIPVAMDSRLPSLRSIFFGRYTPEETRCGFYSSTTTSRTRHDWVTNNVTVFLLDFLKVPAGSSPHIAVISSPSWKLRKRHRVQS